MINELIEFLRYIKKKPLYIFGFIIVIIFIAIGLTAPYILTRPEDAWGLTYDVKNSLKPPSLEHPFGTDIFGRDMFNRVLLGTRYSLFIAISVVGLSLIIGVVIGLIAGYIGGWVGIGLMRIVDMFLAFPPLLLAIAMAAVIGRGVSTTIIALAISWWPWYARLMFIATNSVKNSPYIDAARALGLNELTVMFRHILPNSITPVITQATLDLGSAVLEASSLSFLGVGVPPPIPEWGRLIGEGWNLIDKAWWVSVFPGLALLLTVIGFNLLGDAVKEYMNPRIRSTAVTVRPRWIYRY
ncbi:MAG: ABC transporter permease [Sulfolobales archaeon]